MGKGKSIQVELTGEELQRKIKQITREIQEITEERLRVEVATTKTQLRRWMRIWGQNEEEERH